jgi:transcriptional regulator with XRE-family HTH domain
MIQSRKLDAKRRGSVAELRALGWTLEAIAKQLGISVFMVRSLLRSFPPHLRPSVACRTCGKVIVSAGVLHREEGDTLCVACTMRRPDMPFGHRLKAFRLAAGLTCASLAARAGMPTEFVRLYERLLRKPNLISRAKLARALGLSLELLESGRPVRRTM